MKTSKFFKVLSLASAVTISSFGICLMNQKSASAVDVTPTGWCEHSGAYIVTGNFDGKGGKDALCADSAGSKWINYANGKRWYTKSSWCTHPGSRIVARKENSDKYVDLNCRDSNGRIWVLYANSDGKFNF